MKLWFDFDTEESREKINCDKIYDKSQFESFIEDTKKSVKTLRVSWIFEDTKKSVKTLRVSWLWRSDKKKIVKMSATKLSLSTTKTKHIKVKHPKRKLYRLIIFRVSLLYTDHFIKEFEQTFYMTVKVSFCQTVRCTRIIS